LRLKKLLDIQVPERAQTIRIIMAELTRLQSHLVWLACHALDIGAMTVLSMPSVSVRHHGDL